MAAPRDQASQLVAARLTLTLTLHLSLILPLTLPLPPNPKPNPKPDPNLSPSLTLTLTPTLTRWLRAQRAAWVKGRLSEAETRSAGLLLVDFEPAYIRDVYVWLPDVRWGRDSMPCCPTCETAAHVGNHGFQSKHHARRCAPATAFTQHIACRVLTHINSEPHSPGPPSAATCQHDCAQGARKQHPLLHHVAALHLPSLRDRAPAGRSIAAPYACADIIQQALRMHIARVLHVSCMCTACACALRVHCMCTTDAGQNPSQRACAGSWPAAGRGGRGG